jgi:hypothetical protein
MEDGAGFERPAEGIYRRLAGYIAASVAAHAVCNYKQL